MFESKTFRVDKHRYISYFETGNGKDIILFIHGWLTSKESWIPIIQSMSKKKYRIIAVDLLGHGDSSRSLKLRFDTQENISILTKLVMKLGLKNITIIGHSTGGKISLFLASKLCSISKTLVKKVILLNSIGSYEFWRTLHPVLKISFLQPIRFMFGIFTLSIFIRLYFKKFLFFLPISSTLKENISKYLSEYTSKHFESIRNRICALRITKNIFDVFVEDIDRTLLPDVEIIWSDKDMLIPIQVQYKFSILFKKQVHIIKNAGHMTPIEIPEKVAKLMEKLIQS
ncbi:MAG: alpha/beta hydrolase [Spirochaetes bacterium]|nr:alpha/beta hydrolase [Spirochaetota bacterium]